MSLDLSRRRDEENAEGEVPEGEGEWEGGEEGENDTAGIQVCRIGERSVVLL